MKSLAAILSIVFLLNSSSYSHNTVDLPDPVNDDDYYDSGIPSPEKIELGRLLFFDKELSGNRNISCATCHHPDNGTSDGLSLGLGEGARGLGALRSPGDTETQSVHERVPRNSPALFNLGAKEFTRLFHDGRVELDTKGHYESGFITPAKWKLPAGLENVLAAQALFPVTSSTEMAGQQGENPIANAAALNNMSGPGGVWDLLAKRLQRIPEYVAYFTAAFPNEIEQAEDITFVSAANAIAAYETATFRSYNSPFDRHLRDDHQSISQAQRRGMDLFYGKANCVSCHSGKFQTDHDFHAIAMPQIGPGKAHGRDGSYWKATGHNALLEDFGRGKVSFREEDNFKFRTPSLRNVAKTGPWGHSGAYNSLEAVIRHHLDPINELDEYEFSDEILPPLNRIVETTAREDQLSDAFMSAMRRENYLKRDGWIQKEPELRKRIADANELEPIALTNAEVEDLVKFLQTLTDETLDPEIPNSVPSGLPVED